MFARILRMSQSGDQKGTLEYRVWRGIESLKLKLYPVLDDGSDDFTAFQYVHQMKRAKLKTLYATRAGISPMEYFIPNRKHKQNKSESNVDTVDDVDAGEAKGDSLKDSSGKVVINSMSLPNFLPESFNSMKTIIFGYIECRK